LLTIQVDRRIWDFFSFFLVRVINNGENNTSALFSNVMKNTTVSPFVYAKILNFK